MSSTLRVRLAVVLGAVASSLPAVAADLEHRVVFATANHLERQLDELGREGFACVGLARPEPGSKVPGVVAVLARASNTTRPAASHRVILGGRDDMKLPLSQAGAEGFRLCGVVLDEEPPIARDVADRREHGIEVTAMRQQRATDLHDDIHHGSNLLAECASWEWWI
jgi:hypothetical protein